MIIDLTINKTTERLMSRTTAASYEGFRRKTSLTTLQTYKNGPSLELSLAKLKHNDHLEEVLNLSAQLDSFSKRSFTTRPHSDYALAKSCSSHTLRDPTALLIDYKHTISISKEMEESIMQGEKEWMQAQRALEKEKREKISSSAIFNKFEVIEEDNYLNEEEAIESIEPVTFKHIQPAKPAEKKVLLPKSNMNNRIPQLPIPTRKPAVPSSKVDALPKKEKLKQDINEIDKLQKEFESKRGVRQTTKSNLQITSKRSMKQPVGKEKEKDIGKEGVKGLKQSLQLDSKTQLDSSLRLNRNPMKGSLIIGSKTNEQKADSFLALDQERSQEFNEEKTEPMIATRMLNSKEKQTLIDRLISLQEVIGNNDVCANSLNSITTYISKIEQLLTR